MMSTLVQWGLERAGGHAWLEWKLNKGVSFQRNCGGTSVEENKKVIK